MIDDESVMKYLGDWGIVHVTPSENDPPSESDSLYTVRGFLFHVGPVSFLTPSCFSGEPKQYRVKEWVTLFQLRERLFELAPIVLESISSKDCGNCLHCQGFRPQGTMMVYNGKCESQMYCVKNINAVLMDIYSSILERKAAASSMKPVTKPPKERITKTKVAAKALTSTREGEPGAGNLQPKKKSTAKKAAIASVNEEPPLVKEIVDELKKPKKKPISILMKRRVWATHVGEDIGKTKCMCCKMSDITQMSFHCGHVVSEHNGGLLSLDNLLPICQSCNSSMGTRDLREYKETNGIID